MKRFLKVGQMNTPKGAKISYRIDYLKTYERAAGSIPISWGKRKS